MFSRLLQLLLLLAGSSSAAVAPSLNLTGLPVAFNASITSRAGQLIDPKFQVSISYLEPLLNVEAYLMNCLGAFSDLTSHDPREQLNPTLYPELIVPGVSIVTFAARKGGTIQARFVLWGLYLASADAMMKNYYQGATYTLKWENVVVGYLEITKPEARLSLPADSANLSLTQRSYGLPLPKQMLHKRAFSKIITLPNSGRIAIDVIPQSNTLTMLELFASCFAGFLNIARFPKLQEVDQFEIQPDRRYGTTLEMGGEGPGSRNPDFRYEQVNAALFFLAGHEYQRRTFREVLVVVSKEVSPDVFVKIGSGYISKRRPRV